MHKVLLQSQDFCFEILVKITEPASVSNQHDDPHYRIARISRRRRKDGRGEGFDISR